MRVLVTLSLLWACGAAQHYTQCDVSSCSCLGISLEHLAPKHPAEGALRLQQQNGPDVFLLNLCYPMTAGEGGGHDLAGCANTSIGTSFLRKDTHADQCSYLGDTASMQAAYATADHGVPALDVQYTHLTNTGAGKAGLSTVVITLTQGNDTRPSNVTQVNNSYYTLSWAGLQKTPVQPAPPPPVNVHG